MSEEKKGLLERVPKIGMRNLKTAVAVVVCYFLFYPLRWAGIGMEGTLGPFYACIAAVICMQSSIEQSVRQGVSRVIGTLLGGVMGLLVLMLDDWLEQPVVTGLLLGAGVIVTIWLCNALRRPAACAIGCVVLCVVIINHSGADRYWYTILRVGETLVGVAVAVAVNHLLPGGRGENESGT